MGIRVEIEQQRFLNFVLEAGILNVDGIMPPALQVNRSLLLALLAEIKTTLEDYATANGKYEEIMGQDQPNPDAHGKDADLLEWTQLFSPRKEPTAIEPEGKGRTNWKKISSIGRGVVRSEKQLRKIIFEPKRLVWAVFDKDKFEALASRLAHLNSFLIALLDDTQTKRLQEAMNTSYLEILQLRNDIKSLTGLVEALSRDDGESSKYALSSTASSNSDPLSAAIAKENEVQMKQKKYLKRLAQIKIQYTRMLSGLGDPTAPLLLTSENSRLDLAQFTLNDHEQKKLMRQLNVEYGSQTVWVEWKDLPWEMSSNPTVDHRMQLLVDLLRSEKPEGFRSPPCVGYVKTRMARGVAKSVTRYGIVFENPPGAASTKPITLYRLLKGTRPSLSARISLCVTLAECVHSFHAVNWLHKGLCSNNILFFAEDDSTPPDPTAPYVSGFELSRPDNFAEMTERPAFDAWQDIYRHTSAQSGGQDENFRKAYDMYSLGIVLIEIALWESIDKIMGFDDMADLRPRQLREVRSRLLGNEGVLDSANELLPRSPFLDRVAGNFGDIYRAVVEVCLAADQIEKPLYSGEADVMVKVRLQRVMEEDVVRRLKALEAAMNF